VKSPFEVPVAGVTFRPGYPKNLWDIAGAMVEVFGKTPRVIATLVREPQNEHDPNAIKVLVAAEHVGYIPSREAGGLAPLMDAGERWCGLVDRLVISPENPEQPGLRVKVVKDES
jgi:predicted metallopeptidase